jgi:hypothetical protein
MASTDGEVSKVTRILIRMLGRLWSLLWTANIRDRQTSQDTLPANGTVFISITSSRFLSNNGKVIQHSHLFRFSLVSMFGWLLGTLEDQQAM